ncbi:MAG TPA: hypothetical protein VN456_10310 [Desulfosporosinus sp.]|nr:hypothetical protein [Desulfosporosinus sp.]
MEKGGRKAFHAQNSGGLYIFKDSNRFYHWTSNSKGGAIDFVMKYDGKTFTESAAQLIGESYESYPLRKSRKRSACPTHKAANFKRAYWYLVSIRGIAPEVVSLLMNERKIY